MGRESSVTQHGNPKYHQSEDWFYTQLLMLGREISIPDELFGVTTVIKLSHDVSPHIRELIKT